MKVTVRCPLFPTEDPSQIINSLSRMFPNASIDRTKGQRKEWLDAALIGFESLDTLRLFVHDSRIIDAARRLINSSWTGTIFKIQVDKQALMTKKLNLIEDANIPPLGSIEIIGHCDNDDEYESFLRWFAPTTKDGRIVPD